MNIEEARVLSHEPLSETYRVIVLEAPVIAAAVQPGQFVHVRIPRLADRILRRPFSVFRAGGKTLSILYKQVGRGTATLAEVRTGDPVSLIGPLGNGFPTGHASTFPVLVAGGYGVAPLSFLAEQMAVKGVAFVGAGSRADVLCIEDLKAAGWEVQVSTVDGSMGRRGLVTDAMDAWLKTRRGRMTPEVYACGPDPMLKAVAERALRQGWNAWLSLDKHMGCGVGACLTCVQRILMPDGTETWARICKEGPVFECRNIVWGKHAAT